MKALITGINGFAGSFLAESLLNKGFEVSGTIQPGTGISNISAIKDCLSLYEVDLLKRKDIDEAIKAENPGLVFHLAGISSVKIATDNPELTFETNVGGTESLLGSVLRNTKGSRVLVISSAEIYGKSASGGRKADESAQPAPLNPYAESKALVDALAMKYAAEKGMDIVIARPGNHIGPRQSDDFFVPTVAKQTAMIMKGKKEPVLDLGNIDLSREFTDVRDIADAYVLLAKQGRSGQAYNISSGKQYLLREIAEEFIKLSGKKIMIVLDKEKLRKADIKGLQIDNTKIVTETGWRPKTAIHRTLKDTLNYWLEKTGR